MWMRKATHLHHPQNMKCQTQQIFYHSYFNQKAFCCSILELKETELQGFAWQKARLYKRLQLQWLFYSRVLCRVARFKMGISYEIIDDAYGRLLNRDFTSKFRKGYVDIKGITMTRRYADMADEVLNWEVYDSDLWISSFPKTGKDAMKYTYRSAKIMYYLQYFFYDWVQFWYFSLLVWKEHMFKHTILIINSLLKPVELIFWITFWP